jgi:ABC-2 type transport system permease protein
MIDGFRYGFFGKGDISPWISLGVVMTFLALLVVLSLKMLKSGYKLRG